MARVALSHVEARNIANTFMTSLCKAGQLDVYWLPEERRIAVRVVSCPSGKEVKRVPNGAVHIGRYEHPFKVRLFMGDLDAILAGEGEGH